MNHIEVQIMQQGYRLACPEGQQERLLQAVERVDAAMVRIRDAGKVRARERIAVLAALNLAFELADHQARTAAQPPADVQAQPGSADASPEAMRNEEALPEAVQAAAPAAEPVHQEPAGEPAPHGPHADVPPGGDALEALLRRLDQALGQEGRPA